MGAYLEKPITEKKCEEGEGNGLRYGISCMQGWREEMEDSHRAVTGLGDEKGDWSFFGVFDGHAGGSVSSLASSGLLEKILNNKDFLMEKYPQGIKSSFLSFDMDLYKMGEKKAGSTVVCVFVSPSYFYIANCGDSRGVLCRSGKAHISSRDHKPDDPLETNRIVRAGGRVITKRVNGLLGVSRALGDFRYKVITKGEASGDQLVSPEPDVYVVERNENDEFIILACDGLWDVMTTQDAVDYVRYLLGTTEDPVAVANCLVDTCLYMGSMDNISVVLILFSSAPKPSESEKEKERILNESIKDKMKEVLSNEPGLDFNNLLEHLDGGAIEGLPPGGGLHAKRKLIESYYKELCPSKANTIQILQGEYYTKNFQSNLDKLLLQHATKAGGENPRENE